MNQAIKDSDVFSEIAAACLTIYAARESEMRGWRSLSELFAAVAEDELRREAETNEPHDTDRPPAAEEQDMHAFVENFSHAADRFEEALAHGASGDSVLIGSVSYSDEGEASVRIAADGAVTVEEPAFPTDGGAETKAPDTLGGDVLNLLKRSGAKFTAGEIAKKLESETPPVSKVLAGLIDGGLVSFEGERRAKRYYAVTAVAAE